MTNDRDIYSELYPYLHKDEEVLWIGQPTSFKASGRSIFTAVFSIFFMVFAIFWMAGASAVGGPFFLFGFPFLIIGAIMFYTTTFGHKNGLRKSIYAVTQSRAIIIITLPRKGTSCKEYVFSELKSINLENVKGEVGTIRFEDINLIHYEYGRYTRARSSSYYPERELTTAFIMINDVHTVYHMIYERLAK